MPAVILGLYLCSDDLLLVILHTNDHQQITEYLSFKRLEIPAPTFHWLRKQNAIIVYLFPSASDNGDPVFDDASSIRVGLG